jgi:C4-dicarboxylate-specific signal transduction histidine kinase
MTSNLLTFARKKKFELLPVDLHCLVKKLVELLQHTIDKKVVVSHQLSKGKDQMRCRGGEKSIYVDSLSPRVERGLGGH